MEVWRNRARERRAVPAHDAGHGRRSAASVNNRSPRSSHCFAPARIPPHSGLVNTFDLPPASVVPPECGFRVGNDTRTPVEGGMVFDDTIDEAGTAAIGRG
jgi:hypothetical protein